MPPVSMAATGVPRASASSSTRESGSGQSEGKTSAVARGHRAQHVLAMRPAAHDAAVDARGGGFELQRVGERAFAEHHQGQAGARGRHGGDREARALVLLELADEEQEALGQREGERAARGDGADLHGVHDVRASPRRAGCRPRAAPRRWPRSPPGWRRRGAGPRASRARSPCMYGIAPHESGRGRRHAAVDAARHAARCRSPDTARRG